jgi:ureidoacrylate peracid hydrolase
VNYPLIGNAVMEVDDFLTAIRPSAGSGVAVGDTVYGSDQGKIGTVEEIVPAQDGAPGYLVVPRGLVFDKDTFIPLDAVTHRAQDRVFINIPKLVIGKLPWAERPTAATAATARSKLGPPSAEVSALYRHHAPSGRPDPAG